MIQLNWIKDYEMNEHDLNDFISISGLVKKTGRKGGRSPFSNNLSISQKCRIINNQQVRFMTISIPEEVMSKARFKKGDRIDISFKTDGMIWRLKLVSNGGQGYTITTPSNNSKRGQLRLTWCEGIPIIGGDMSITKARAFAVEKSMKVSPAELIFELGEIVVEAKG